MTVVLEYASVEAAPRIGSKTLGKDLGDGEVVSVQFSDALRMLEYLEPRVDSALVAEAWRAGSQPRDSRG
jgi:hypothetical protein